MIKEAARRVLGTFIRRYRVPSRPGLITIRDEVSGQDLRLTWRHDSMMETAFFRHGLYGAWERHSLRLWAHLSAGANEILDVGANTGIFSLLARKNNGAATIVAIEPIPANADVLQANVDANAARVIVERSAMSDRDGEATMYMLKDQLNYMTAVDDDRYARHPEVAGNAAVVPISIPLVTWSTLAARHRLSGPDLIKVDVEGHEVAVLESLRAHIVARQPTMLIEIIGDDNAARLDQMLRPLGYTFISIDETARSASVVDRLWDNDHQNFLVCTREIADGLRARGFVQTAGRA